MANINDFGERFRLGHASANPFTARGTGSRSDWCPHCKCEVTYRQESHHQGTMYAFKRWCRRCGQVISRGVFDNVVTLTGETPTHRDAVDWSKEREELTR